MNVHILSVLVMVGSIFIQPVETPDEPPTPEGPAQIVFASNRGEDPNVLGLYLLDPETLEVTPLETGFEVTYLPRWSPDGTQILFSVPGVWHLYSIEPNGENLTQITDFRSNNGDWSPDGSQIVFQSDHDNEPEDTPDIYIIDIDGENLVEILDDPEVVDFGPRWSGAGDKILFISARTGNYEVYLMNTDGSDQVQVTDSGAPILNAALSPDGSKIVFTYPQGENFTDLFIIDNDGSTDSVVRLTEDADRDINPVWSPDGEKIVFHSNKSGTADLWMINADGTDLVQLTNDEFYDDYPDW